MSVLIQSVEAGSPADKKRIKAGDRLVSLNGNAVRDVLDYRFYMTESKLKLLLETEKGLRRVTVRKAEYEDLGLNFETYLMDEQRRCRNNCVFCFIDQMPKGMRDSLYFKDDDSRLSFLFGNYITLTNLSKEDVDRIIAMHISPINVSVHTTNPSLRCRMMNNRFAGDSLQILHRLAEARIALNCQLVLCPEWNTGEELSRSLRDLAALYPAIKSVAAVPVGLTKYRDGLTPLRLFTKEEAADVIARMEAANAALLDTEDCCLFYPSDEFFILAEQTMPHEEYYGEFAQLENGVGMSALLKSQFTETLEVCEDTPNGSRLLLITGKLAAPLIQELVAIAKQKWPSLQAEVMAIRNDFFGETITVAGLITGQDIIAQVKGKTADYLLFPDCMLRREGDCFLDDITPQEVEEAVGISVKAIGADGADLVDALLL